MHSTAGRVNDGTYIAFMVLMAVGFLLAWCLSDSKYIKRKDGSRVIVMKHPTWKSEIRGLIETLRTDTYIVLLFPMFLASNWFTAYQFNAVNGAYFDIRTRALNSLLYWLSQMIGAFVFGQLLDFPGVRRTIRAKANLVLLFVITMGIWGGGYAFQKQYTRDTVQPTKDFNDSGYVGPMFLYMFYGFYDAAFQTCAYWSVSLLSIGPISKTDVLTGTGSWALSATTAASLPTLPVSTRASSPPVRQARGGKYSSSCLVMHTLFFSPVIYTLLPHTSPSTC